MCVLKEAGWTICTNPITGRLTISRNGQNGWIEIPIIEGALHARIIDENERIAESITVRHEHLGRTE